MAARPFSKPIRVASPKDRTYKDVLYHSKMEMHYAMVLDDLVEMGDLDYWLRQIKFQLGPDNSLVVDFVCFEIEHQVEPVPHLNIHAVDVKGYKQKGWGKKRKLWRKYANVELRVLTKKYGAPWETIEIIEPSPERT